MLNHIGQIPAVAAQKFLTKMRLFLRGKRSHSMMPSLI